MSDEQVLFPKPDRIERLKKNGHVIGCNCASCRGSRNRRKGLTKQRAIAKTLGLKADYRGQLAQEENWRHPLFRFEIKTGLQVPKKLQAAYAQSRLAKASGDTRPVVTVWVPDGHSQEDAIFVGNLKEVLNVIDNIGPDNTQALRDTLAKIAAMAEAAKNLVR